MFMCRYKPWYLEECSSTLATTYSSGTPGHDKSVATVDMDGKLRPDHICTVEHTGMIETFFHDVLYSERQ
jgi:proprotein convertase subtilisin/kexin type 5